MYSQIRTSRYDAISYSLCITLQAMILYGGYYVYEPDDVYLAEKPKFIKWFAIILFIHATASGFSWFYYAIAPDKCHGLSFLLAIYIIDQFCDLFYTLFPLIVVWNDEYNRNITKTSRTQSSMRFFKNTYISCNLLLVVSQHVPVATGQVSFWFYRIPVDTARGIWNRKLSI